MSLVYSHILEPDETVIFRCKDVVTGKKTTPVFRKQILFLNK